jgi:hypothetical protein
MNTTTQASQLTNVDSINNELPTEFTELDIFALMAIGGGGEVVNMN